MHHEQPPPVHCIALFDPEHSTGEETMNCVYLNYHTADIIRRAFLPINPRRLRNASPEVRQAIADYLDALYAAKPNGDKKESNAQADGPDKKGQP
jgi:hypothetical protein